MMGIESSSVLFVDGRMLEKKGKRMYDAVEGLTVKFNTSHEEYLDKRKTARKTCDGSELRTAYEERKNKGQALGDHYLRELDLENSRRIDEALAGLEREHHDLLRELRGI